jgi:2-methylisocitrate lyase-like PEP mutase family enzyme
MSDASEDRSGTFRRLHAGPDILILANAWDAGSARLIESLGAKAVATTSAGMAWSNGYPDGNALPAARLEASVSAIARAVQLPLSVDVEGGYSSDPAAVGETVARVVGAGAVGINLEDGTEPPELLCAKIEHVKRAAARLGTDVFVNARTDVYLRGLARGDAALDETIARARRYRQAGCDGLFVPALTDSAAIGALLAAIDLPLNVLAWPGLAPAAALRTLGVRRLSAGAEVARVALNGARSFATAFLAEGRSVPAAEGALTTREMNGLFASR